MFGTRMEKGRVGVTRSTVDTHRVRVHNRASVEPTIARRAYRSAPYLRMHIDPAKLFGAEILLDNRFDNSETQALLAHLNLVSPKKITNLLEKKLILASEAQKQYIKNTSGAPARVRRRPPARRPRCLPPPLEGSADKWLSDRTLAVTI
ncbi:hypothetical protein EVAR_103983_1 [Eumeta japonica]|uniref:Uncharacterized protein n=1 Tax=Eumeta variegata TaxID=151549 RepID=A0A4C1XY07_EUMVA|nr:hypothetical protein EVAR_103983_1 [Eumeta japonica]